MRVGLQRSLMALAASALLSGVSGSAQANEDGLGGLFQRLFSPEPQAQAVQALPAVPQASSAQPDHLPTWRQYDGRRYAQSPEGARLRPKTRYASLPKPQSEPLQVRITDRQVSLDLKDGAAQAFLKDKTLRLGDIIMLQDGARVFTGSPDKPHALNDFENIGRSEFIDRHTRTKLAAMMVPVGAITVAEARKRMEQSKTLPSVASTPVQVQATAMRIIYPWTYTP